MRVFSPPQAALFLPAAVTRHPATNLPVRTDYKHLTLQACQVQCCQQVPRLTADKTAGDEARFSHPPRSGEQRRPVSNRSDVTKQWRTPRRRPCIRPSALLMGGLERKPRAGTSEEPGPRRPGELEGGVEVMRNSVSSYRRS